jgi:hypothetical protein
MMAGWLHGFDPQGTGVESHYFCRPRIGPNVFWRQSPDGSRVLAFNDPAWYSATVNPSTLETVVQGMRRAGEPQWLTSFGVGDHGGGPTAADLIENHRLDALPAFPQLRFSSAAETFQRLRKAEPPGGYPVLSDERAGTGAPLLQRQRGRFLHSLHRSLCRPALFVAHLRSTTGRSAVTCWVDGSRWLQIAARRRTRRETQRPGCRTHSFRAYSRSARW